MFVPSKPQVLAIALVALVITNGINLHRWHEGEKVKAQLPQIYQELLAKNADLSRLPLAEEALLKGQYDQAIPVIKTLATQGNPKAQHTLGFAYRIGMGVEQDYRQALHWFMKASEGGQQQLSYSAAYYIGEIYFKGLGDVDIDKDKAIHWLTYARDNGIEEAEVFLK
ncbi:tetratricopeptide repeat protein [Thaumasiovibrio subtropicus]|uniref:tetratricopeptide repeat protein n=1 Tax=Thaumasiovibrio subtropicus TaxID=1891207 RepID=UPI000B35DA3B|nr:tetratricopeptide repeat protein [Thaumasiovibrio subtropicus]